MARLILRAPSGGPFDRAAAIPLNGPAEGKARVVLTLHVPPAPHGVGADDRRVVLFQPPARSAAGRSVTCPGPAAGPRLTARLQACLDAFAESLETLDALVASLRSTAYDDGRRPGDGPADAHKLATAA